MTVEYEWTIELLAEDNDDIIDVDHADSYKEAVDRYKNDEPYNICLVRDDYGRGIGGRSWAYVVDGVLETELKDAYDNIECNTPKRFIKEVEKYHG